MARKTPQTSMEQTLFGTVTVKKRRCKCCGEIKEEKEFYVQSKGAWTVVRMVCIECWNQFNGKYKPVETPLDESLTNFLS
jgi:hypothetical protein